uniref:Uncharacterized protein n=1 Tax=Arundo donax TaxID=35708 RepID=A0A0A9A0V3_ARUDO
MLEMLMPRSERSGLARGRWKLSLPATVSLRTSMWRSSTPHSAA